ncbi:MAG: hypothetical protein HIU85_18895, partial [Proteobacteria bacterium]|nr:hypothetical protein [Pseudomonadota bacterium]
MNTKARLRKRVYAAAALGAALAGLAAGPSAMAVSRLVLTAGQIASPQATLDGVKLSLDLDGGLSADAHVAHLEVRSPSAPALQDLRLSCGSVALGPQDFACPAGRLAARAGAFGPLSAAMSVAFERRSHTWKIDVTRIPLASGRAQIAGLLKPGGWSLDVRAAGIDIDQALRLVRPWASLPAGYQVSGHAAVRVALRNRPALTVRVEARSADLNLSNAPGTVVAQQVTASVSGTLARRNGILRLDARVSGSRGQALAGPVLLDFGANPLTLDARLRRTGNGPVIVSRLALVQRNLMRAQARAVVQLSARPEIVSGHVRVASLRFPAAYSSYLQLALATTALGSLQSSGRASASIDIAHDAITRLDCSLHDGNFTGPGSRVLIQHASGDIHWTA